MTVPLFKKAEKQWLTFRLFVFSNKVKWNETESNKQTIRLKAETELKQKKEMLFSRKIHM